MVLEVGGSLWSTLCRGGLWVAVARALDMGGGCYGA